MTRQEHLDWSKQRAIEYVQQGDLAGAMASMVSDLQKHPDLENHIGIQLGMAQMFGGMLSTPAQMVHFIEGFN